MSMGTFDAFTSARLGIYAAQYGLRVTGNNVSNINTEGYTRQRLDQVSFKAGAYDKYRSQMDNQIGSGALVMNINQVRDPYLDVRFRNTSAKVGYHDKMVAGLQEVADILDEIGLGEDPDSNEKGDGLLHAQLQDIRDKLLAYQKEPTKANNDLVRTSAEVLCSLLNQYAGKLDRLYQDTVEDFKSGIDEINECLTSIRDLNREIRDNEIFGDNALELRDERNRQIDKLSKYLHIKTVYTEEDIGVGVKVEKLSIYLDNDNPDDKAYTDESMLIDGVFGAQLSSPKERVKYNPYFGSKNPDLAGVKDYLYLTDKPLTDANGHHIYKKTDGTFETVDPNNPNPSNGSVPVMAGTNSVEDADKTENDTFSLQLSKLVDENGKEWEGVTVTYEDVPADDLKGPFNPADGTNAKGWKEKEPAVPAVYSFKFTPSGAQWKAGDTFQIGGTTCTVGGTGADSIPLADANKPQELAKFIAGKLQDSDAYKDKYTVETATDADGNTIIKFSAKEGGAIPVSQRPKLTVSNDTAGKLTFSERLVITAGKDAVLEPPTVADEIDPLTGTKTSVSYIQSGGTWQKKTTVTEYTKEVALDDNDTGGALQAIRELLTEKGEFTSKSTVAELDENGAEKRGIPYYQLSLDLLARQLAAQYNKINTGYKQDKDGNYINEKGELLELGSVPGVPISAVNGLTDAQKQALTDAGLVDKDGNPDITQWLEKTTTLPDGSPNPNGAVKMGGVLFSNRNDGDFTTDITASNISVSHSWSNGSVQLVPTYREIFLEDGESMNHSTQCDNVGHMVSMVDKSLLYDPADLVDDPVSNKLFEGNFNDMFSKMNTICGQDIRKNSLALDTQYGQMVQIDTLRDGVSGVDLNDEAMNMMQFQKALNASMRLMTVIDEALDRLINNTGIAGR